MACRDRARGTLAPIDRYHSNDRTGKNQRDAGMPNTGRNRPFAEGLLIVASLGIPRYIRTLLVMRGAPGTETPPRRDPADDDRRPD